MTQLNWLGSGLKCQVCNGPTGLCANGSDNGESKECSKGLNACYYLPGGKRIFKFNKGVSIHLNTRIFSH